MINENKKLYSNTKKTKDRIKKAFLDLLGEKELSKINITELVKLSQIYRATFYLHYASLNDVVLDIEKDMQDKYSLIGSLMQDVDIQKSPQNLVETMSSFIEEDRDYLRIIINTNCFNRITLKLKDLLEIIIIENFKKYGHDTESRSFKTKLSFIAGGIVFAYRDWVSSNSPNIKNIRPYLLDSLKQLTS